MGAISETRTYADLLSTTLAEYIPTLYDQVFDVYPFLSWVNGSLGEKTRRKRKSIKKVVSGGESIVVELMYGKNTTAKPYAGAEPLDTSLQEGVTIARFDWKQYAATIGITGIDLRKNKGKHAVLNLAKTRTEQAEMSLRDIMNPHLLGDGTSYGGKSFTGTGALISATSTVGGVSVTAVPQWKSIIDSAGFSWAAQGRAKLRTMFNNLSYGNDVPDAIFTDQTTYESVEASMEDKERIGTKGALELGFDSLSYKGVLVTWDRDFTAGTMEFYNSAYMDFYVHEDADLKASKFVQPFGQDILSANIILQANLIVKNRRMFGRLSGITA